jgi:hypothetical protein
MLVRRDQLGECARLFAQPAILRVELGLARCPAVQLVEGAHAEHGTLWRVEAEAYSSKIQKMCEGKNSKFEKYQYHIITRNNVVYQDGIAKIHAVPSCGVTGTLMLKKRERDVNHKGSKWHLRRPTCRSSACADTRSWPCRHRCRRRDQATIQQARKRQTQRPVSEAAPSTCDSPPDGSGSTFDDMHTGHNTHLLEIVTCNASGSPLKQCRPALRIIQR